MTITRKTSERIAIAVFAIAFGTGIVRRWSLPTPAGAALYHQRVRELAATAHDPADWVGTDIPIPQASLDELKPNVAVSRRYTHRRSGRIVDLLIIQSPDIRDLVPHYPPVCYPGQGLMLTKSERVLLAWPAMDVTAIRYTFQWHDFHRGEPTVVDNFMILPTGETQPDTAGMEKRIGTDRRYFGSAQVQVVYVSALSADEQTTAATEILGPFLPLFKAIESGKN